MPALSGPRSVMPISIVSRWRPSSGCRAGFFRNSPTMPHMALLPSRGFGRIVKHLPCRVQATGNIFSCQETAPAASAALRALIGDDREEADRQLPELLGPMRHVGIEEQAVARGQ